MVDFQKLLAERARAASELPSFPQKDKTYHIDAQEPGFSEIDDWIEQERFGKMTRRKQTLYIVNTEEGKLRLSPNQIQQLQDTLKNVEVNNKTEYIEVCTTKGDDALLFFLPRTEK